MVKKLEILDFEDKMGANGRYTRFKTSKGWMSCFDRKTSEDLKEMEGKGSVSVNVKVNEKDGNTFTNITGISTGNEGDDDSSSDSDTDVVPKEEFVPSAQMFKIHQEKAKQAGVAMRYAIDLLIANKIEVSELRKNFIAIHDMMIAVAYKE